MPAFAEVAGDTFPSNGYMLENKTYANAATYGNIGAYDGAVTATAEYEDILYQIGAGTYLPAGATVAEQCPANSYCPGVTNATYNETASQGVSSCPSGYPNSDAGASSNTQCYTTCTVNSANIEHATAVDGNDYYNTDADTCVATACENGYHTYETMRVFEKAPSVAISSQPIDAGWINAYGEIKDLSNLVENHASTFGLSESNTWAVRFDEGIVYGRASCQPESEAYEAIIPALQKYHNGEITIEELRSELTNYWGAAWANALVDSLMAVEAGNMSEEELDMIGNVLMTLEWDTGYSTTDTGGYCYCQMTGFQSGSSSVVSIVSAPWVHDSDSAAGSCASLCTRKCIELYMVPGENTDYDKWKADAILDKYAVVPANTCSANEIKINWTDATEADITANNAGMCTYGGDIRTPVRAETKPGKTFVGWKFDVME